MSFVPPPKTEYDKKLDAVKEIFKGKKIFLSEAYIWEVGTGVYQAFKRTMVEEKDPKTGQPVQEVITVPGVPNEVPWGGELVEAKPGDPVVAHTFANQKMIPLTALKEEVRLRLKGRFPSL
jgi:hypothetical protein